MSIQGSINSALGSATAAAAIGKHFVDAKVAEENAKNARIAVETEQSNRTERAAEIAQTEHGKLIEKALDTADEATKLRGEIEELQKADVLDKEAIEKKLGEYEEVSKQIDAATKKALQYNERAQNIYGDAYVRTGKDVWKQKYTAESEDVDILRGILDDKDTFAKDIRDSMKPKAAEKAAAKTLEANIDQQRTHEEKMEARINDIKKNEKLNRAQRRALDRIMRSGKVSNDLKTQLSDELGGKK